MHRWIWAVALVGLSLAGGVRAQEPAGGDVAGELARMNATLGEIAELLGRMDDAQGLDLLMKRVQLASARIGEDERRLRSAEGELRSLEAENGSLELQLTLAEERAIDEPGAEREATIAMIERQMQWVRRRSNELSLEVNELRNRLTERERDLEGWQQLVDRRLGGH